MRRRHALYSMDYSRPSSPLRMQSVTAMLKATEQNLKLTNSFAFFIHFIIFRSLNRRFYEPSSRTSNEVAIRPFSSSGIVRRPLGTSLVLKDPLSRRDSVESAPLDENLVGALNFDVIDNAMNKLRGDVQNELNVFLSMAEKKVIDSDEAISSRLNSVADIIRSEQNDRNTQVEDRLGEFKTLADNVRVSISENNHKMIQSEMDVRNLKSELGSYVTFQSMNHSINREINLIKQDFTRISSSFAEIEGVVHFNEDNNKRSLLEIDDKFRSLNDKFINKQDERRIINQCIESAITAVKDRIGGSDKEILLQSLGRTVPSIENKLRHTSEQSDRRHQELNDIIENMKATVITELRALKAELDSLRPNSPREPSSPPRDSPSRTNALVIEELVSQKILEVKYSLRESLMQSLKNELKEDLLRELGSKIQKDIALAVPLATTEMNSRLNQNNAFTHKDADHNSSSPLLFPGSNASNILGQNTHNVSSNQALNSRIQASEQLSSSIASRLHKVEKSLAHMKLNATLSDTKKSSSSLNHQMKSNPMDQTAQEQQTQRELAALRAKLRSLDATIMSMTSKMDTITLNSPNFVDEHIAKGGSKDPDRVLDVKVDSLSRRFRNVEDSCRALERRVFTVESALVDTSLIVQAPSSSTIFNNNNDKSRNRNKQSAHNSTSTTMYLSNLNADNKAANSSPSYLFHLDTHRRDKTNFDHDRDEVIHIPSDLSSSQSDSKRYQDGFKSSVSAIDVKSIEPSTSRSMHMNTSRHLSPTHGTNHNGNDQSKASRHLEPPLSRIEGNATEGSESSYFDSSDEANKSPNTARRNDNVHEKGSENQNEDIESNKPSPKRTNFRISANSEHEYFFSRSQAGSNDHRPKNRSDNKRSLHNESSVASFTFKRSTELSPSHSPSSPAGKESERYVNTRTSNDSLQQHTGFYGAAGERSDPYFLREVGSESSSNLASHNYEDQNGKGALRIAHKLVSTSGLPYDEDMSEQTDLLLHAQPSSDEEVSTGMKFNIPGDKRNNSSSKFLNVNDRRKNMLASAENTDSLGFHNSISSAQTSPFQYKNKNHEVLEESEQQVENGFTNSYFDTESSPIRKISSRRHKASLIEGSPTSPKSIEYERDESNGDGESSRPEWFVVSQKPSVRQNLALNMSSPSSSLSYINSFDKVDESSPDNKAAKKKVVPGSQKSNSVTNDKLLGGIPQLNLLIPNSKNYINDINTSRSKFEGSSSVNNNFFSNAIDPLLTQGNIKLGANNNNNSNIILLSARSSSSASNNPKKSHHELGNYPVSSLKNKPLQLGQQINSSSFVGNDNQTQIKGNHVIQTSNQQIHPAVSPNALLSPPSNNRQLAAPAISSASSFFDNSPSVGASSPSLSANKNTITSSFPPKEQETKSKEKEVDEVRFLLGLSPTSVQTSEIEDGKFDSMAKMSNSNLATHQNIGLQKEKSNIYNRSNNGLGEYNSNVDSKGSNSEFGDSSSSSSLINHNQSSAQYSAVNNRQKLHNDQIQAPLTNTVESSILPDHTQVEEDDSSSYFDSSDKDEEIGMEVKAESPIGNANTAKLAPPAWLSSLNNSGHLNVGGINNNVNMTSSKNVLSAAPTVTSDESNMNNLEKLLNNIPGISTISQTQNSRPNLAPLNSNNNNLASLNATGNSVLAAKPAGLLPKLENYSNTGSDDGSSSSFFDSSEDEENKKNITQQTNRVAPMTSFTSSHSTSNYSQHAALDGALKDGRTPKLEGLLSRSSAQQSSRPLGAAMNRLNHLNKAGDDTTKQSSESEYATPFSQVPMRSLNEIASRNDVRTFITGKDGSSSQGDDRTSSSPSPMAVVGNQPRNQGLKSNQMLNNDSSKNGNYGVEKLSFGMSEGSEGEFGDDSEDLGSDLKHLDFGF